MPTRSLRGPGASRGGTTGLPPRRLQREVSARRARSSAPQKKAAAAPARTVQTRKRPDLRESIHELLDTVIPVARDGGAVSLVTLAQAIAGERMEPRMRRPLEERDEMIFSGTEGGATFQNDGEEVSVRLKKFALKIPRSLRGRVEMLDEGVLLHFDPRHSLQACKSFFCIRIERLELTRRRVFVDLEGDSFDQCFELQ